MLFVISTPAAVSHSAHTSSLVLVQHYKSEVVQLALAVLHTVGPD